MRNRATVYAISGLVLAFAVLWSISERNKVSPLAFKDSSDSSIHKLSAEGIAKAPDISIIFKDKKVSLHDYPGKVVLLDFWGTWCPPCRESIPGVVALYNKYKDKGFQVVGPAMERDGGERVPVAADMMGMTYPVGLPTDGDVAEAYGATSLPLMVLIDKKGMVRWHQNGYRQGMESIVEGYVQQLLAE